MISTVLFFVAFAASVTLAVVTDDYSMEIGAICMATFSLGLALLSLTTTEKE